MRSSRMTGKLFQNAYLHKIVIQRAIVADASTSVCLSLDLSVGDYTVQNFLSECAAIKDRVGGPSEGDIELDLCIMSSNPSTGVTFPRIEKIQMVPPMWLEYYFLEYASDDYEKPIGTVSIVGTIGVNTYDSVRIGEGLE